MALPRGLINSRKFVTYNRDEVTWAERQPLETRSDGLGAYLTPQQALGTKPSFPTWYTVSTL